MKTITLDHLTALLSRPAFTRGRCLTFAQLLELKRQADYNWDMYWELEMYDQCIRYTKVAQRILQAMLNHPDKFINISK